MTTRRGIYVTARQMRALDRKAIVEYGIPSVALMENAGRAVAEEVKEFKPRCVMLYCGSGNNGGDGFVAARHLASQGIRCAAVHFQPAGAMKGDARLNFNILREMKVPLLLWKHPAEALRQEYLNTADLLVDALFGTGLSRKLTEPYTSAIAEMNGAGKPVVSVDIPSGMHADTGKPMGACVRATRTVTLAFPKQAFSRAASRAWTGRVVVADISIPVKVCREYNKKSNLTKEEK